MSTSAGNDGYYTPATVTGHLYYDVNGNGVQEAGEPNLANVTVTVTSGANVVQVSTGPNGNWSASVPQEARYDWATNPTGARASVFDHTISVYGRDPQTGFARRPVDNVGVQYGLQALNEGAITLAQFLDLNEKVGGLDVDAHYQTARMVADPLGCLRVR